MNNPLFAITTLFAMSACSTSFDGQEEQEIEVPTAESGSVDMERALDNADVSAMTLPSANIDTNDLFVGVESTNSGSLTNVLPTFPMGAINVKVVDGELQLRMFPETDAYMKICTHGVTTDCFAGKASPMDNMAASEASLDISKLDNPERFTLRFSDGVSSYREFGPFTVPTDENIWKEVVSCEAELALDYVDYYIDVSGPRDFAVLDFSTDLDASAMVCGIDKADENVCVWEDLQSGQRAIRIAVDRSSTYPAIIRDPKGCSLHVNVTTP